jgi:chromate transporter
MMRSLAPDRERATLAVVAAALVLAVPTVWGQIGAILLGLVVGVTLLRSAAPVDHVSMPHAVSRTAAIVAIVVFFTLLFGLPLLVAAFPNHGLQLFEAFYRAGSLVFGGGHVVLPLLQASVVPPGWVSNDDFLAGYGAAQAVPGPLFTFSAYLGTVMGPAPNGWAGAALCLVAMFLPSFLLVIGPLPFWDDLRRRPWAQSALRGVNAAVVGLLLAARYNPVWTAGILSPADFALGAAAFLLLFMWQVPPWIVVVLSALGGAAIGLL